MSEKQPLQNLVPLPYRHVSVQPYAGPLTAAAIEGHLLGKDSYRRTRYVVLEQSERSERCAAFHRHQRDACAERDDARPQEWAQCFTEHGERDE